MAKLQGKIGILGGTFDPVHNGHIAIAKAAMKEAALDKVILMVANVPWQKIGQKIDSKTHKISSAKDRLEMVEAAVFSEDGLEAGDNEIRRGGDTYAVDTLKELEGELYFILGSDVMAEIDTWVNPEEVKRLAKFIVVERPDFPCDSKDGSGGVGDEVNGENNAGGKVDDSVRAIKVKGPYLDISSSDIRSRIKSDKEVSNLLPEPVLKLISDKNLYR